MSSDATPISPTRFAAALKGLSLSSLHLKVLELRNNIAHLDYSNEQLRPFAEGTQSTPTSPPSQPDPDCVEAIKENEEVIARMQERIRLVREEVEGRGFSWTEFQSKEEAEAATEEAAATAQQHTLVNGHTEPNTTATDQQQSTQTNTQTADGQRQHSAWTDGTFQTGVISNGAIHMHNTNGSNTGGSISDEELRRRMEQQLRNLSTDDDGEDDDNEGGLHL
jgi:hypothetical protein